MKIRPEVEAEARRRWEERERGFPGFTRVSWEQGSPLARALLLSDAADALGLPLTLDPDLFDRPAPG
jgi:hypothetical protein